MLVKGDNLNKHKDFKKNFDFILFILTMVTAIFGVVMISSAAPTAGKYVAVQLASLGLGLAVIAVLMVSASRISPSNITSGAWRRHDLNAER